jgi:hypothetical protein
MIGIIIIAISYFFIITSVVEILTGKSDTEPNILWGLLIFFFLLSAGGVYMLLKDMLVLGIYAVMVALFLLVFSMKTLKITREKNLLKFIESKNGRVTPLELVTEFNMTTEQAKETLDKLCENIGGELNVTENGGLVYVFEGFISKEEKETASDPIHDA